MRIVIDLGYMKYTFWGIIAWGQSSSMNEFIFITTKDELTRATTTTYLPKKDIISIEIKEKQDE